MSLNYESLRSSLKAYYEKHGVWVELAKSSGISPENIARIAKGHVKKPTVETWEKLYKAAPNEIPSPFEMLIEDEDLNEWRRQIQHHTDNQKIHDHILQVDKDIQFKKLPLFDAGAGEPSTFSDGGHPKGHSSHYVMVPKEGLDDHSFAVKIHGDSMSPYLNEGDIAVVVPSAPLQQGKLCFATWFHDEVGDRLVKRYYKYGDTVVLKSDNPDHEDIVLDETNGTVVKLFRVTRSIREE